jgi:hypothetical protein
MNAAFGTRKKSPGLLIWHIDQGQVTAGGPSNSVNVGSVQGVALEQADGLNELRSVGGDRGDAGDTYPGTTTNRRYNVHDQSRRPGQPGCLRWIRDRLDYP